jgi:hypothetical protein
MKNATEQAGPTRRHGDRCDEEGIAHPPRRRSQLRGCALGALVALALMALAPGVAQARPAEPMAKASAAGAGAACIVHSLPSFVAQGEGSLEATVADVVEVECDPTVYGRSLVTVSSSQLSLRCSGRLHWYVANPFEAREGPGVTVRLDADGSATVALVAGPCMAGEALIAVHMKEEPFESFTTAFTVLPPAPTRPGVYALPATQVEDAASSGVATIIEAEYPGGSEKRVRIASEELFSRCRAEPHLRWVRMDGSVTPVNGEGSPEITQIPLDNDGNAFVIALGDSSCAEGPSLIEADLENKPFEQFMTTFTILPPQPTAEPSFTIEKLQQLGDSGFTTATLSGAVGDTVDYRILVTNTGRVPETLEGFADPNCAPGTISGGPGSQALAPTQTTTYSCSRTLPAVGTYVNEASVTAHTVGGDPLTLSSNQVVVNVPAQPAFTIEKLQRLDGATSSFTSSLLTAAVGQAVDYEIVVENTGNVPLDLATFADAQCDPGTIAGGPGGASLAPGSSVTYTCSRLLAAPGSYFNEVTLAASASGQAPFNHTSNQVEVDVKPSVSGLNIIKNEPPPPPNKTPKLEPRGRCEASTPALRGASGLKRVPFTVELSALGIKQIMFYLDGREVKKLQQSQAKRGSFALQIDPRKLSYGPHTVVVKTFMSNRACPRISRSGVFKHPRPAHGPSPFTG